jgi:polysaccharide export outer membrane protein
MIEPPDILVIDALRLVPRPPYHIEPLDSLAIRVSETLPDQPISGIYTVEPDGTINLGFNYGVVRVSGLTLDKAQAELEKHLRKRLKPNVQVNLAIAESRAMQQIRGPHLVRVDGTVSLGVYGSVYVDNLTIDQAKAAIEAHLSQYLVKPEISLDVGGYNSKVFYVITDNGGAGQIVNRLPVTGKTTVLDAIGLVNGLSPVSSKHHICVVRPAPVGSGEEQTLAVDWVGITQRGETLTNYQVLPGDRVFVQSDVRVRLDTNLARILSPVERAFGITLLGTTTVQALKGQGFATVVR